MNLNWHPPDHWLKITTLDAHTGGEPLRIILDGLPPVPGKTILEKRRYFRDHLDHLRTGLMWEPRGHADMYGAVLTEPVTPDGHCGVFFLHNEGYSTMCGHAIIALGHVLPETGLLGIPVDAGELRVDTPAGRVTIRPERENGRLVRASFRNVPSFVAAAGCPVEVPGFGTVAVDVAFGGAFYAFCEAEPLGLALVPENHGRLIEAGRRIKHAVAAAVPLVHPRDRDLEFLYGTIFTGPPADPRHHSRNVCIFAEGELDRSPTGTGVSARAAIHHRRGELAPGEAITIESILGTTMEVRVAQTVTDGPYPAVIPEVSGQAFLTGTSTYWFDPADPLANGFILR